MKAVLLLLLLACPAAYAQGTGTLAGLVTGGQGGGVPGATVVLEGSVLGAAADAAGAYRIIGVPEGTHVLWVTGSSGAMARKDSVVVQSGRELLVDVDLVADAADPSGALSYEREIIVMHYIGVPRVVSGENIHLLPVQWLGQQPAERKLIQRGGGASVAEK